MGTIGFALAQTQYEQIVTQPFGKLLSASLAPTVSTLQTFSKSISANLAPVATGTLSGSFNSTQLTGTPPNYEITITYNWTASFSGPNQPPNAPTLDSPAADSRHTVGASLTFTWTFSDPDGDSQSAYQFQLDDNSDFSSPLTDTGKTSSSNSSTSQTLPNTVGLYYWRVKTWDSQNAEGSWSTGQSIIVDNLSFSNINVSGGTQNPTVSVTVKHEYDNTDASFDVSYPLKGYVGGVEVGSTTGTGQLTLNLTTTLNGSGNITLQGTDATYGISGSYNIPFDVLVQNLYAGDQSVVEGNPLTFQVGWDNASTVNGAPLQVENTELRIKVLDGATEVLSHVVSLGTLEYGNGTYQPTVDTSTLGIGTYTLRLQLYQIGSEWLLAQADSILNVTAEEAPGGPSGPSGPSSLPPPTYAFSLSAPTLSLRPGEQVLTTLVLSYPPDIVSITLNDVSFSGPYADWCHLEVSLPKTINRLTVSTQDWGNFTIPVRVTLPGNVMPGTYPIAVKVSLTGSGGATYQVSTALNVEVPSQTAPQETTNLIGIALAAVAALALGVPVIWRSLKS
jgi:hypothetical protein